MSFVPQWIIEAKRDGAKLSTADITEWINRYTEGSIPDYQMAALAMAIYFNGMDEEETLALTNAMMNSGDTLSWEFLDRPTADKHSTGGIGDKLSIPLAPLVASAGVAVPMISGRGLGITGGTLDKLDSIPGYQTSVSTERFRQIVQDVGCSIIGQTARLAPADKKLYALRDVTGTVPSQPLITASILSKKLAEGAETLVFDVKYGKGAFMKTPETARELGESFIAVARGAGRKAAVLPTDMNQPVGLAAGNALEIRESVDILHGRGPKDATELVFELGVPMLTLSGVAASPDEARATLEKNLYSGAALEVFTHMVEAQGGDPAVATAPERVLPQAPCKVDVVAREGGTVTEVCASDIGRIVLLLGGGRQAVTDVIDYSVGVDNLVKVGAKVSKGDVLMRLNARSCDEAVAMMSAALDAVKIA